MIYHISQAENWRAASEAGVYLPLPEDLQLLALGVIVEAGEADAGLLAGLGGRDDLRDEVLARADPGDLARLGSSRSRHSVVLQRPESSADPEGPEQSVRGRRLMWPSSPWA